MAADRVSIGGRWYRYARKNLIPEGARQWSVTRRPTQLGDPGHPEVAIWQLDSPHLYSTENISQGNGFLGVNYLSGLDSRWSDQLTLGPLVNTLTVSTYDPSYTTTAWDSGLWDSDHWDASGAAATSVAEAGAMVEGSSGSFVYVVGGRYVRKLSVANPPVLQADSHVLAEAGRVAFVSYRDDNTPELSVGMDSAPYEVMNLVNNAPSTDSWVVNSQGTINRIMGHGDDRDIGMQGNTVRGNIIAGSVTMADPNWIDIETIKGEKLLPTGFALDGNVWVLGYDNGPYYLNTSELIFVPIIREIDRNSANCRQMSTWYPVGVLIPMARGLRYLNAGRGASFGPEIVKGNASPIQGEPTANGSGEKWHYQVFFSSKDSNYYLVAYQTQGDPRNNIGMAPYVIANFSTNACRWMQFIGTANGILTQPMLIGGYGTTQIFYINMGLQVDEVDDAAYRFTSTGTGYLTELRRFPHTVKDLEAIEFETSGCTSARTVSLGFSDGNTGSITYLSGTLLDANSRALNGVVKENGVHRQLFVNDSNVPITTFQGLARPRPAVIMATDSSSATPRILGPLKAFFRCRPTMTTLYDFYLELDEDSAGHDYSAEEQGDQLLAEWGNGPIAVVDDLDGDSYYVRVENIKIHEVEAKAHGDEHTDYVIRLAEVSFCKWPTSSGD